MDKIAIIDTLDEVSLKIKGIILLANMRINDLNNPNGSLSNEDIKSILEVAIQLLKYQYMDIRNIRDLLLLMDEWKEKRMSQKDIHFILILFIFQEHSYM